MRFAQLVTELKREGSKNDRQRRLGVRAGQDWAEFQKLNFRTPEERLQFLAKLITKAAHLRAIEPLIDLMMRQ